MFFFCILGFPEPKTRRRRAGGGRTSSLVRCKTRLYATTRVATRVGMGATIPFDPSTGSARSRPSPV